MNRMLKLSTAFTFRIGPFLDETDGKTAETGLTIAQADIQISKNGGAFAQTSDASPTTTHDKDGWYQCPLTVTDTNTLGWLTVQIKVAGALPVWVDLVVAPAAALDIDSFGRIRIVDGSSAGELQTLAGSVLVGSFTAAASQDVGNVLATTVDVVFSQTALRLNAGSTIGDMYADDALYVAISDASDPGTVNVRRITAYDESTKEITIDSACAFTVVGGDGVRILPDNALRAVLKARELSVGAVGEASADVTKVSGVTAAADNLQLQYDGTGLTGPTFPSTQTQLDNIALTGAALNTPAKSAPDGFNITFGENEANDEDSTNALDGTTHDIEAQLDGTEKIDVYYEFTVGGDGISTGVTAHHLLDKGGGGTKNISVLAFNWVTTTWDQIGTLESGTLLQTDNFTLFTAHVGMGANIGLVRIRYNTGSVAFSSTTKLIVDQIFVSFAVVNRTVGYEDGSIWVNTNASNENTEPFIDGTADNPVSTWAAALTLSANLGITRFAIINGSTIVLTAASDNFTLIGMAWNLDLGGQSIDGAFFSGAKDVSGTGTNGTFRPSFLGCAFEDATIPPCACSLCFFGGKITFGEVGDFIFADCRSSISGMGQPVFDFGAGLNASNLGLRNWFGGVEIENMGAGTGSYNMSLEGAGALTINANCSATSTVVIRGPFTIVDNAGGAVTVADDARYDVNQINAECDTAIADAGLSTAAQVAALNDPTVTEIKTGVWNALKTDHKEVGSIGQNMNATVNGKAVAGTLSTTQMSTDLTEATDDHFNGRLITWLEGVLKDQSTDITDYDGASKTLTYTATTEAPTADDTFLIS